MSNHSAPTTSFQTNASTPPPTPSQHLDFANQHLQNLAAQTLDLAKSYHHIGLQYHSLPLRIRFEDAAKHVRTEASHAFTVSANRELPEMITRIGTMDMLVRQIEALLAEPVDEVKLERVKMKFAILERQIAEAREVVARLWGIVRVYVEVVVPREIWLGRDLGRVKVENGERKDRMLERWVAALPEICFGGREEHASPEGAGDGLDGDESECEFILD